MNLSSLRDKIDEIDNQILELLKQRAAIAFQIGKLKNQNNVAIVSKDREIEIINRLAQKNNSYLSEEDIKSIFSLIIQKCRAVQLLPE